MASGSGLVASAGNVNFNGTNAGSVTVQPVSGTTPLGNISAAGNVNLNIGSGSATVAANSIFGTVQDPNANFTTQASGNVSITTAGSGTVTIGNFAAATGNTITIANNTNPESINTVGNLTADSITVQGNGGITVNLGNGTTMTARASNVDFNNTTAGPINVTGTGGTISANNAIILNAGTGSVNVNVNQLIGCVETTASSVSITTQAGGLTFCNGVDTSSSTGSGGAITIIANGGTVNIGNSINSSGTGSGNSAGAITITGSGGVNTNSNNVSAIGSTGASGGIINISSSGGNINVANVASNSSGGNGGLITITATTGAVNISNVTSNASGSGNGAGAVNITAGNGITFANINANGTSGASGGSASLTSTGQAITGNYISATGNGGNGGSVNTSSSTLVLNGADAANNSISTLSTGGNGGTVSVTTTSSDTFTVGGNGNLTGNGTAGNINASGINGGFITITSYGNNTTGNQIINGSVLANGTTGTGGNILFQGQQPAGSAPLMTTVNSGGLVQATNTADTSGIIGFNAGVGEGVDLNGSGTVHAGQVVNVGALNPSTLALLNVAAGTVLISPSLSIGNAVATNGYIPPPPTPVVPETSNSSGLGLFGVTNLSGTTFTGDLPSLTATDQTPFFSFSNLNVELTEEEDDQSDNTYTIAGVEDENRFIAGTTISAFNFGSDEIDRLARDGVFIANESGANSLTLENGNILTTPDRDVLIATSDTRIFVGAGATVFIMKAGENVVIYDLIQTRPKQVSVVVNKQRMIMEPGRMLAITKQNVEQLQNLPVNCHAVAYRKAQQIDLNGNVRVFAANFSIASALSTIQPLRRLTASPYKQDQITLEKLWKDAQIEGDFARSSQPFQNADMGR